MRESAYNAYQASEMSNLITRVGGFFAVMMAAAAVFGAMSTLLVMVESRRFEVALLRALGYPHGIVFAATLVEGSLLGVAGGVVGAAAAYVGLDGYAASTLGMGGELTVSTTTPHHRGPGFAPEPFDQLQVRNQVRMPGQRSAAHEQR